MKETSYHVKPQPFYIKFINIRERNKLSRKATTILYRAVYGGSDGVYGGSTGAPKGRDGAPEGSDGAPKVEVVLPKVAMMLPNVVLVSGEDGA